MSSTKSFTTSLTSINVVETSVTYNNVGVSAKIAPVEFDAESNTASLSLFSV